MKDRLELEMSARDRKETTDFVTAGPEPRIIAFPASRMVRKGRIGRQKIGLPEPGLERWTARHKTAVVQAVHLGYLTLPEVLDRYAMSMEEFCHWQRDYGGGLDATQRLPGPDEVDG